MFNLDEHTKRMEEAYEKLQDSPLLSRDTNGQFPTVSDSFAVQAFYEQMRRDGQSHAFAEMAALQQPPGSMGTDSAFWSGGLNSGTHMDHWPWPVRNFYLKKARQHGVDTAGKIYKPSLARFPGDPEAWISGRGDITKLAEKYNLDVSGAVEHRCDESLMQELVEKKNPPVPIAKDIVDREVFKECVKNPEKALDLEETRAEVADRLTPHHKKSNALKVI